MPENTERKYVEVYLTGLQAKVLMRLMEKVGNNIESTAVGQIRPITPQEDLDIDVCAVVYSQISMQQNEIDYQELERDRSHHIVRCKRELQRQKINN